MTDIVNYKKKYLKYKRKYLELSQKGGSCYFTLTTDDRLFCLHKKAEKLNNELLQNNTIIEKIKIINKNIPIINKILKILKKDLEENEEYSDALIGNGTVINHRELHLVQQRIAKYNKDIKYYTRLQNSYLQILAL